MSAGRDLRRGRVDLGECARRAVAVLKAEFRDAAFRVFLGALPVVEGDRGLLTELLRHVGVGSGSGLPFPFHPSRGGGVISSAPFTVPSVEDNLSDTAMLRPFFKQADPTPEEHSGGGPHHVEQPQGTEGMLRGGRDAFFTKPMDLEGLEKLVHGVVAFSASNSLA